MGVWFTGPIISLDLSEVILCMILSPSFIRNWSCVKRVTSHLRYQIVFVRKCHKVYFKALLFCTHLEWCNSHLWRPDRCRDCCCVLQQCVHIVILEPWLSQEHCSQFVEGGVNSILFAVNYAWAHKLVYLALGHTHSGYMYGQENAWWLELLGCSMAAFIHGIWPTS